MRAVRTRRKWPLAGQRCRAPIAYGETIEEAMTKVEALALQAAEPVEGEQCPAPSAQERWDP